MIGPVAPAHVSYGVGFDKGSKSNFINTTNLHIAIPHCIIDDPANTTNLYTTIPQRIIENLVNCKTTPILTIVYSRLEALH